jgi:hypothetical protein
MIKFILAIVGFLGIIASAKYPKKSNELGDNFNIGGRLFRQSYLKWGLMLIAFALIPFFNSIIYDKGNIDEDIVGQYYWDPGLGYEVKVFLNEDGTWRKDVYENGELSEPLFANEFSGKYQILEKTIKKADKSYTVNIITFDNGKSGYLFNGSCFKGLSEDIWYQTNISTAEIPFPGINEGGGRSYCKK